MITDTWRALLEPPRLVAVGAVVGPLLYAQAHYNAEPWDGVLAGATLCASAVLVAPVAWRALSPLRGGLSLYALVGLGTVLLAAIVLPRWLHFEDRFLTQPETLPFVMGLWIAAGWGLGRDVAAERAMAELVRAREHAELLAIRAHLDPHFLFNTLNALAEWCRLDPTVAERALLQLASVLRSVLGAVKEPLWPLSQELALAEQVMSLYRVRDPDRFAFDVRGEPPQLAVPTLILLPLVENAFKYGPGEGHPGQVTLRVERTPEGARVTLRNPGPFQGERPAGHGLALVRQRLRLHGGGSLQIGTDGQETVAVLELHQADQPSL
jgi:two-component system sensor histidine kinase AlgZ